MKKYLKCYKIILLVHHLMIINDQNMVNGNVYVITETRLKEWVGITPPAMPYVAGFGVAVKDLNATRDFLVARKISSKNHPYPAIWVEPQYTCGPVLTFSQA